MIKLPKEYKLTCNWDENRECTNGMFCGICEFQPNDDDKPNGRKEPIHFRWQNDYGIVVPYCPSCGEMAYSTERCVFCGQRFLPTENPHKPERTTIGGYFDKNGILRCSACGSDALALLSHEDGADFFGYTYVCSCGHHVAVKTKLMGAR